MTKIKNFRLNLRTREMARWLKKERGLETTPELELAIEQAAKEAKTAIETAAIYTTLTRQIAEKTTTLMFPNKAIAVSIVAVSIGPALQAKHEASQGDLLTGSLLAAVHQEALAQSLQFVVRLIQEQAKEEDCEMTAAMTDFPAGQTALPFAASSLASLLGVARIGIPLDGAGSELPPYSRVAWLFWTPVGKGTTKRAEKVAA
jgi:hypothetical protein